nr:septum formation initiator family protein [Myxococcota bacterium]
MSKALADTYVAPASRRWGTRLGLAIVVAIGIGYVPGQVMRRDPRSAKLQTQLDELAVEARALAITNAGLTREINALRSDVGTVEDRARADLGMVYPDEIVLRVSPVPAAAMPGAPAPLGRTDDRHPPVARPA